MIKFERNKIMKIMIKGNRKNISEIPRLPGIYIIYSKYGDIMYVGKSHDVRSRIYDHFLSCCPYFYESPKVIWKQSPTSLKNKTNDISHFRYILLPEVKTDKELRTIEKCLIKILLPPLNWRA